jgi:hypothetical protein
MPFRAIIGSTGVKESEAANVPAQRTFPLAAVALSYTVIVAAVRTAIPQNIPG